MRKSIRILLLILFLLIMLSINSNVKAATATIKASTNSAEVGGNVTLTININAASWSLTASGDGITTKKYADVTSDGLVGNKTETITLDTSSEGTKKIKLTGTVSEPSGDGTKKTNIDTSVEVTVKKKAETNTNTNTNTTKPQEPKKGTLDLVKINNIKVKEFLNVTNKDSASIYIETSNGEGATIYNSLTKKSSKVKNKNSVNVPILEGTNTLTITLESGNKYTRKIYSKKEEEVKPNVIEEPVVETKVILKSLTVKGYKTEEELVDLTITPEFSSEVYEYTINIPEELNDITKLNVETVGDKKEFTVEVTGNEELIDGENIVTILVKSKDGEKTSTYQIKVNKEPKVEEVVAPVMTNEIEDDNQNVNNKQTVKIVMLTCTIVIITLGIIVVIVKYKKEKSDDDFEETPMEFASVGFEKEEDTKEDVLKDYREDEEVEKPKKKGKHF